MPPLPYPLPLLPLLAIIPAFSLGFSLLRSVLSAFASRYARMACRRIHGPEWEASNGAKISKFGESFFKLACHSSAAGFGYARLSTADWYVSTVKIWAQQDRWVPPTAIHVYYLLQIAYNLEAFAHLLSYSVRFSRKPAAPFVTVSRLPTMRGDFKEMFVHHVCTDLLLLLSYRYQFLRIGCLILLLHDTSDVPIDIAKMCNFLKLQAATAFFFFLIVVFWIWQRIYLFPSKVLYSVMFETTTDLVPDRPEYYDPATFWYKFVKTGFSVLLIALYLLHIFWLHTFVKMGYALVFKGETHDLSVYKRGERQGAHGATDDNNEPPSDPDKEQPKKTQ